MIKVNLVSSRSIGVHTASGTTFLESNKVSEVVFVNQDQLDTVLSYGCVKVVEVKKAPVVEVAQKVVEVKPQVKTVSAPVEALPKPKGLA